MITDDLIASLAAGVTPVRRGVMTRAMALGLGVGVGLAALVFYVFWGIRPDVATAMRDPFLLAKTALPLLIGCLAVPVGMAMARPGGTSRMTAALWLVPAILCVLIVAALVVTPTGQWQAAFYGSSIVTCLTSIPLLSAPILAGLLVMLRRGAPEHPAACGAAAGLVAAGLGAAIYSLYCTEDSPLFYGVWYTLAMLGVVAVATVIGSRLLRW